MRSVSTAKRVRLLCTLVTLYGVLILVGGIAAGVLLAVHRRHIAFQIDAAGNYVPPRVTHPYVVAGVGVGIGSLVLATLVVWVAEIVRLRANVVIDDRAAAAAAAAAVPARSAVAAAVVAPSGSNRRSAGQRRAHMRGGRRVVVLTEEEKAILAGSPPPNPAEGWYPDPLRDADLRRWTGTQWTGEQQSIALPPS